MPRQTVFIDYKATDGVSKTVKSMRGQILKTTAAVIASGIALKKTFDFAREGAQVENLRKSFELMGGSAKSLDALSKSLNRTLDDATLIRMANMAKTLGITNKQFAELARIGKAASIVLGQDVTFAIDSIITGTARQSRLMLDNVGIIVDLAKANKTYAEALGRTVESLSESERKQAFISATIAAGQKIIAGAGESATDGFDQLTVALKNMGNTLKEAVNPPMGIFTAFLARQINLLNTPIPEGTFGALLGSDRMPKQIEASSKAIQNFLRDTRKLQEIEPVTFIDLGEETFEDDEQSLSDREIRAAKATFERNKELAISDSERVEIRIANMKRIEEGQIANTNALIETQTILLAAEEKIQENRISAAQTGLQALGMLFPQVKAFAKANALITMFQAVSSARATIPFFPVGLAMAALAFAQGIQTIRQIDSVTPMAKGGIVTRPTFAMVGEAGPEAVIPLDRAGQIGRTVNIAAVNLNLPNVRTLGKDLIKSPDFIPSLLREMEKQSRRKQLSRQGLI